MNDVLDKERQRTDEEMQRVSDELNAERTAYQNLLRKHAELEQRFENMQVPKLRILQ